MSLRKIEDEQLCRTYYVEPLYAAGPGDDADRRRLTGFDVSAVEEEASDGSIERLEGEDAQACAPRIWDLLNADESLRESLERPRSALDEVNVSHIQRMRELRRRLKIRRSLEQDIG